MSEAYQKLQAAQQKRKLEIAARLGLGAAQAQLAGVAPNTAAAIARSHKASTPKTKKRTAEPIEPQEGTRKSARGGQLWNDEQAQAQKAVEEADRLAEEEKQWAEKHGTKGLNPVQHKVLAGSTQAETDSVELLRLLNEAGDVEVPFVAERNNTDDEYDRLAASLQELTLRGIVRAVQGRVYSMIVHPTVDRDLVLVGDKVGHIGLWDATEAGKRDGGPTNGAIRDGAEAEDPTTQDDVGQTYLGKHWHWRVHQEDKAVSCLRFRPTEKRSLYSSSHDCTMRCTDLETGESEEILDADYFKEDCFYHSFDFSLDGNQLWACDSQGGLTFRDMREPRELSRRWNVDRNRISSIQLNPANQNLAVTSHLKGMTRLWDLRKLHGTPQDATDDTTNAIVKVADFYHGKRSSGANFDFTGTKLVGTSYNEQIHLWDINPLEPETHQAEGAFLPYETILHNNMVGRDVTEFKATWSNCPTQPLHFTIGSLTRELDVFKPDGTLLGQLWSPEAVQAPAVTACHPTLEGKMYGGTAAGKIVFYAKPYGA